MARKPKTPRFATLYHVTTAKNAAKIVVEGIWPQVEPMFQGRYGQDVREVKGSIFAFTHPEDAVRFAHGMSWEKGSPKTVIILFYTDLNLWKPDTHFQSGFAAGEWLTSLEFVGPNSIVSVIPFDPTRIRMIPKKTFNNVTYLDEPLKTLLELAPIDRRA